MSAVHHPQELALVLEAALPRLRAHINSLRSSLCKTALICATDFLNAHGDGMLEHLHCGSPSLLESLLQRAALEKKFVMVGDPGGGARGGDERGGKPGRS